MWFNWLRDEIGIIASQKSLKKPVSSHPITFKYPLHDTGTHMPYDL